MIERPGKRTERPHAAASGPDLAIDAPGVRAIVRRRRNILVGVAVVAIASAMLVPAFTGIAQRRHDHLQRVGIDTTAVVTDYHTGKTTSVDFRIVVNGTDRPYTYDSPPEEYEVGDEVAVRMLRDGSYLEIDGEQFDSLASGPASAAISVAVGLGLTALFLGIRFVRHQRDLSRHRFVSLVVTRYYLASNGRAAIVAWDRDGRRLLRLAHITTGKRLRASWRGLHDPGRILIAGPPDRTSIALLPPDRLLHVSRSRNPLRIWWWQRGLRGNGSIAPPE